MRKAMKLMSEMVLSAADAFSCITYGVGVRGISACLQTFSMGVSTFKG